MKKHEIFKHVWKAIDHTVLLALSYFPYLTLVSTDEYLPHTVLDCKFIDPQATTSSYQFDPPWDFLIARNELASYAQEREPNIQYQFIIYVWFCGYLIDRENKASS